MKHFFTNFLKLTLHYLLSLVTYGIFTIPIMLIIVAIVIAISETPMADKLLMAAVQPLIDVDEKGLMPIVTTTFLISVAILKIFLKTKIETWVTTHIKIILLTITIIFALAYLTLRGSDGDPAAVIFFFYAATIISTIFALITTKITLLLHWGIDHLNISS